MIPAAQLKVIVSMKGVPKSNAEALKFHGTLKDISGETAEATLKANVDGRGFTEFKAKMTDAKLRAATPIVQEARLKYDRGAFSDLRREIFLTRKAMSGLGSEHGIGSALSGAVLPFGKIGSAALAAGGPVLNLAGGVTALGGSLVGAAEGAGALGIAAGGVATVGLGSLIAIAVPAVSSLKALTEAQKSYIAAVETYGVQSTQAETAGKKLQAVERMSGKEAVGLVKNLDDVKERWASITKPGREAFLGGLSDAIDRVDKKLPLLGNAANRSAEVGRKGFDTFLNQVTGSDFTKFVKTMTNTEENIVPQLSHATGDWGQVLERVATDAAPSLERVAGTFSHWSDEVLASTGNSHKLSGEISHLTDDFMDWVHLLDASGHLLKDIFDAGEGSGNELVVDTTQQFNEWGEWIDHHGPKVEAFFAQTKQGVEVLASILGHVGQDWFVMSQAMEPVETLTLHILDDFAKLKIGGQSLLTYLLGGFVALKYGIAALKIKSLLEDQGLLKTLAQENAGAAGDEAAALQAQADAAGAAAIATGDLAAAQQELLIANSSGTVVSTVPVAAAPAAEAAAPAAATEAEVAGAGGLGAAASKIGKTLGKGIAVAAGGYFVAEIGAQIVEKATGSNFLEGQSVFKSLTHGFATGHVARTEQDTFQKTEQLDFHKSKAQLESLQHSFATTMGKLRSDAATGMGSIDGALITGLKQADETWLKGSDKWRGHTAMAMHEAVEEIKQGMAGGEISAAEGQKRIDQLLSQIHVVKGNDPFGLAEATTRQFKQVGAITSAGVSDWTHKLERMPPAARHQTTLATEGMLAAWAQGHPKLEAQVANLVSKETELFGHGASQLEAQSAGAMAGVAGSFGSGADNVRKAIANIMENMSGALAAEGAKNQPHFSLKVLSAASTYHNLREKTESGFQEGGFIVGGSGSGDRPGYTGEPGGFVLNRKATAAYGFARGGQIPLALEPGERYFSPPEVQRVGAHNLASMNSSVSRFQKGGALGPEPQIGGPSGSLLDIGRDAVHQVYSGAKAYVDAHKPKMPASIGGGEFTGKTPAGVGSFQGFPVDNWIIPELEYAVAHGWTGHITSGFRTLQHSAELGFPNDEHTKRSYPGGAVDFGGMHEAAASANRAEFIAATRGYKGPKLQLPVGFVDDGHMSGTGHQLGGFVQHLITGGEALEVPTVMHPSTSTSAASTSKTKTPKTHDGFATGVGYTVKGIKASEQQMHTAMEIQKAGDSSSAPYLARVAAMMAATQESDMGAATHNTFEVTATTGAGNANDNAYTQGLRWFGTGYYDGPVLGAGGGIAKSHKSSDPGLIAQEVEGSAHPALYEQWKGEGQKWTGGWGQTGHGTKAEEVAGTFKEAVPAQYKGVFAKKSLSIGTSTPKTLHGIQREEQQRRGELARYRRVARLAAQENKPAIAHAIGLNVTALETRLSQLRRAASNLRAKIAKQHFTKHLGKSLGKVTGVERSVELAQRDYQEKSELAQRITELEPTEPILAASASEDQRRGAEEAYVGQLSGYIHGRVEPAYMGVLQSEAAWRNTILGGEHAASGFTQNQEFRVRVLEHAIDTINALTESTAKEAQNWSDSKKGKEWREAHPGQDYPSGLKARIETAADQRATLPTLRFEEAERRKALGEGRAEFYGGRKEPVQPPNAPIAGTGTFEQALIEVQGTHWPGLHSPMKRLPTTRAAAGFGGAIWDTQAQMEELNLRIAQANAAVAPPGSSEGSEAPAGGEEATTPTAEVNHEREELLEGLLREANQRLAIDASLAPTLTQFEQSYPTAPPYMGAFAEGGIAMVGERGPELVGLPNGTRVHSNRDSERMLGGDMRVVVNGSIHQAPGDTRDAVEILEKDPRAERWVNRVRDSKQRGVVTTGAPRAFRG